MNINLKSVFDVKDYEGLIVLFDENKIENEELKLPLDHLIKSKKLEAKDGNMCRFSLQAEDSLAETAVVVLGEKHYGSYRKLLKLFGEAYRSIKRSKALAIAVVMNNKDLQISDELVMSAAEAVLMADYTFDTFKTDKKSGGEITVDIILRKPGKYESLITEAKALAGANLYARELVNLPANKLYPETLAGKVKELGSEKGFETEVLGYDEIKALGMDAYLSVAKGSEREPKFIIMRYKGNPDSEDTLGYVGKGLTFDSGGYSIKSTKGMIAMKGDMGGAAAVIGAISAIAGMKLKVNVTAVVAACENMISGSSYRPSDIIGSMGGKSIFIGNTDAEGRLTLVDAMQYITTKENVTRVLDIATLTGAAIKCTGSQASVVIGNDDDFFEAADSSFNKCGERIWRMPVYDEYKELIKHSEADLTNIAGDPGTITAGLLIGEFINDVPWLHVDIAGTFWSTEQSGIYTKGGTGSAVRPLYHLAKELAE